MSHSTPPIQRRRRPLPDATGTTAAWVMTALAALVGCDRLIGIKEARNADDTPDIDAAIDAPIDMSTACMPSACRFGCDPSMNQCRANKLWIFKTSGTFLGNAFGGTDTPPNVRAGADGRCLVTYLAAFSARQCSNDNVHAILYVTAGDSIALMAAKYNIPTDVEVYRAEDNVLVSNNWNDLTDPSKSLRAAATTAATDGEGLVWTGSISQNTCLNWTSGMSTDNGTRGYADRTDSAWLGEDFFRCDRLAALLCICWPGNG
jgi:hypothetical protein